MMRWECQPSANCGQVVWEVKPHKRLVTELMKNINMTIPSLSADLVGSTEEPPAMTFAALSHIFENQLKPDMNTVPPEVMSKLKSLTSSPDLDVKALSLASIHLIKGSDEKTRRSWKIKFQSWGQTKIRSVTDGPSPLHFLVIYPTLILAVPGWQEVWEFRGGLPKIFGIKT